MKQTTGTKHLVLIRRYAGLAHAAGAGAVPGRGAAAGAAESGIAATAVFFLRFLRADGGPPAIAQA